MTDGMTEGKAIRQHDITSDIPIETQQLLSLVMAGALTYVDKGRIEPLRKHNIQSPQRGQQIRDQ